MTRHSRSTPLRVLLVDRVGVAGGAERSLSELAAHLPSWGVEATAVVGGPGPLGGWLRGAGCPTRVLDNPGDDLADAVATALAGTDGAGANAGGRPVDVVLSMGARTHVVAGRVAEAHGVPACWWLELTPRGRPYEHDAAAVPAACVLTPTPIAAARLAGAHPELVTAVVAPGIDLAGVRSRRSERDVVRRSLGWEQAEVVGMIARLDPCKGQDLLLDAGALVLARRPRCRLLFVGGKVVDNGGPDASELERRARDLGIGDRVRVVEHQDDPIPWAASLDVAVSASTHEVFGLSILEAMATGAAVVATRTDGAEHLLDAGAAGWLVDERSPRLLADAICSALDTAPHDARRTVAAVRSGQFDATAAAGAAAAVLRAVTPPRAGAAIRRDRGESTTLRPGPTLPGREALALVRDHPAWWTDPFSTPTWLDAAAEILEAGATVEGRTLLRDGTVAAVVLLVTGGDRPPRLLGDPLADATGPVHDPTDAAALADALPSLLDQVVEDHGRFTTAGLALPAALQVAARARATVTISPTPSPVVELAAGWHDYLEGPTARRRRRIVNQAATLLARSDVVIHGTGASDDAERDGAGLDVAAAFDVLVDLHAARFGAASRTFADRRGPFLRHVVTELARTGDASIRVLGVGGRPAAAILTLRRGDEVAYYQSGRDCAVADHSVGRALLADTLRVAAVQGCRRFRLLRGGERYKTWWATGDEPVATLDMGPAGAAGCRA